MIKRERYLAKIRSFYASDLIKVITGIRRCGKSVLLRQIIEEIKEEEVDDDHIVYLNLEDVGYAYIKDYLDLNTYIKDRIKDDGKYYLFFDEIQMIEQWERAVNSFRATLNVSIFITGSNSRLLSSELATLLAGRYVAFKIAPFSFKEVVTLKGLTDKRDIEAAFDDYLIWGGMPQRFEFKDDEARYNYLSDVFSSIVLKDIVQRNRIGNINLFERIMKYLVTNPAQTLSVTNMLKEFEKAKIPVSSKTVYDCLDYALGAMLMNRTVAYDIRGKRILSRKDKYYLTDLGLGQVLNVNKKTQYGAYLENIIFNELTLRNYQVSVGNIQGHEIDFVVNKHREIAYYQVAFALSDDAAREREFSAFAKIDDHYPKYILSLDKWDYSQNGIIHKNAIDWLLEE